MLFLLKVEAKNYERRIDNTMYFSHDKGEFGEEVAKKVAEDNHLGKDISDLFEVPPLLKLNNGSLPWRVNTLPPMPPTPGAYRASSNP